MSDLNPQKIADSQTRQSDLAYARRDYSEWKRLNPDGDWLLEALYERPVKGTDFIPKRDQFGNLSFW